MPNDVLVLSALEAVKQVDAIMARGWPSTNDAVEELFCRLGQRSEGLFEGTRARSTRIQRFADSLLGDVF